MRKLNWSASRPRTPPAVEKRRKETNQHGVTLCDDYGWLKAPNWQEVLRNPTALPREIRALLDAENDYARPCSRRSPGYAPHFSRRCAGGSRKTIPRFPAKTARGSIMPATSKGGQHPIFCRVKRSGGPEEVFLDGDAQGRGKSFFDVGAACHSPDHAKLAWSADETGSELYSIRIRDLNSGRAGGIGRPRESPEVIADTGGSLVWMADFAWLLLCADR